MTTPKSSAPRIDLGYGYSMKDISLAELRKIEEGIAALDKDEHTNTSYVIETLKIAGVTPSPSTMKLSVARAVYKEFNEILSWSKSPENFTSGQ